MRCVRTAKTTFESKLDMIILFYVSLNNLQTKTMKKKLVIVKWKKPLLLLLRKVEMRNKSTRFRSISLYKGHLFTWYCNKYKIYCILYIKANNVAIHKYDTWNWTLREILKFMLSKFRNFAIFSVHIIEFPSLTI